LQIRTAQISTAKAGSIPALLLRSAEVIGTGQVSAKFRTTQIGTVACCTEAAGQCNRTTEVAPRKSVIAWEVGVTQAGISQ